ncbi:CobW family GTP-binding protein [Pleomorphovibrio marinus]|uniref:CobW family GTP-binding protein n=1 Tax=Pleomorphovibrio marinus TaxID=2164132 RepID=UPI000E0AB48B|nr:GTP-binding protein [Pleomorphovibrio marinus]
MENTQKISTYILTGFLGSGKTTVLNHLLEREKGKRNFVIENEFGKTSVDGALVKKNFNRLFELNNGCICCTLDAELIEVLAQLIQSEHQPDQLFIEASGVADAGMLASVFKREDVMQYFELSQVICLVDAENFEDRIKEVPEMYRQLVAADLILINKCDLVQASYASKLHPTIEKLNPFAIVSGVINGAFNFGLLGRKSDFNFSKGLPSSIEVKANGHRMKSISVQVPTPVDRDKLYTALTMTLFLHYHQVYRIKGFVRFEDEPGLVLVQSTGNKLTFKACPEMVKETELVLVFIGRDIERPGIERILNRLWSTNEIDR